MTCVYCYKGTFQEVKRPKNGYTFYIDFNWKRITIISEKMLQQIKSVSREEWIYSFKSLNLTCKIAFLL